MRQTVRYRLSVTVRTLAAMLGGYVLTSLLAVSSFLLLQRQGMARDEALLAPTIASFLIYATIVLAVFHARSAMRAWLWIIGACAPLAVLILLLLDGRTGP